MTFKELQTALNKLIEEHPLLADDSFYLYEDTETLDQSGPITRYAALVAISSGIEIGIGGNKYWREETQ